MTYGEIKIEALKLMGVGWDDDLYTEGLDAYAQDENYKGYLANMPGAVNRALARIEERRVMPVKAYELKLTQGIPTACYIRYELGAHISDFFDVDRIILESDYGDYDGNCDFTMEADTLVLPRYEEEDRLHYTVLYNPKLTRVSVATENDTEIGVPDNIAAHIPYYVMSDLFREDEPGEAAQARNIFESALDEIVGRRTERVGRVKSVYDQVEW